MQLLLKSERRADKAKLKTTPVQKAICEQVNERLCEHALHVAARVRECRIYPTNTEHQLVIDLSRSRKSSFINACLISLARTSLKTLKIVWMLLNAVCVNPIPTTIDEFVCNIENIAFQIHRTRHKRKRLIWIWPASGIERKTVNAHDDAFKPCMEIALVVLQNGIQITCIALETFHLKRLVYVCRLI